MKERCAEPDECYVVGKTLNDFPEVVLEVIHTSPLWNKLEVYAGFGVAEVCLFKDDAFSLYAFDPQSGGYGQIARSKLMPSLDFAIIARMQCVRILPARCASEFEA